MNSRVASNFFIVAFLCVFSTLVQSSSKSWSQLEYAHYAENEPLVLLLQEFAMGVDVPIIISDEVAGEVNGNFEEMNAKDFIDYICRVYSLAWYFDGQVLYVYPASAIETLILDIDPLVAKRVRSALGRLKVLDRRYKLIMSSELGILKTAGPPRYIELVSQVVDIVKAQAAIPIRDEFVVRTFELKYARATDRSLQIGGRPVSVDGVATTIRSILGRTIPEPTLTQEQNTRIRGLKGTGLIEQYDSNASHSQESDLIHQQNVETSGAYVVADERLNAIIVHDRHTRMPLYEELIKTLDKPSDQIEIEVSIIDVSTDKLDEMGFEWQINGKNGSFATADFSNGALPRNSSELSLVLGNGANFSTLLTNTKDYFLTRISALSENGDARILSQPTILTLNNSEAILDHSSTFFVRLAGEREVDLFPISVGAVLRVTPQIIEEKSIRKVYMDINIEDGQQTSQTVDDIPVISRSVIATQALIDESASLLIGGYYYNQDVERTSKVPVLGDIPVLGYLFKTDVSTVQKTARLFLITPKIVSSKHDTEIKQQALSMINEYNRQKLVMTFRQDKSKSFSNEAKSVQPRYKTKQQRREAGDL